MRTRVMPHDRATLSRPHVATGLLLALALLPGCSRAPADTVVGAKAPDIAGVDLDGVAFALSDYRGKVVLLDFWGDW